jgi:YjbE family integral membrane protein
MEKILIFLVSALQITLLDMVLAGDNIGVIALAVKNLPDALAKKASLIGVSAAIGLRMLFASIVTYVMMIEWLPLKLIGGLLLVKVTWDFIKPQLDEQDSDKEQNNKAVTKFWGAVICIIAADISMSLDNVLAVGAAAHGHIGLIVFGLLLNIPVIFFGSQFVANLMRKYTFVVYIGGAVLAHTAFAMIFEDNLISSHVPHMLGIAIPFVIAACTLGYGLYVIKRMSGTLEI